MNLSNDFTKLFKEQSEKLKLVLAALNLPDYTFEETDRIVANYGWYLPPFIEVSTVFSVMKLYHNNKISEMESLLVKYFKSNLKKIESRLIDKHLERAEIIKEAFHAHRKKMYYSSTILFLSQADGICDSIIFSGSKMKKAKIQIKNHPIVKILGEENPLTEHYNSKTKNSNYFSDLNRHGVMHGLSNEYGNELNSLKALSLVCCVSDFSRYKSK
mgnify:CR=1 FL=1